MCERCELLETEIERLNSLLYGGRCVYCGEVVGVDTLNQDLSDEVLKEHIKTCAAHPYVQMKSRAEKAESQFTAAQQSAKEQFARGMERAASICLELEDGDKHFYTASKCARLIREAAKEASK